MAESAEEKRKREQWEKERAFDEAKRRDSGLTEPELKKYQPASDPVIDESASTHQKEQPRITDSVSTAQSQQPKKPSRFDSVRKKFEEKGEELRENFSRGARLTAEDLRESASKKVRSKLNRLNPEEEKQELKKMREQLSAMRTRQQLEKAKAKIRAANASENQRVFADNESSFFGMSMHSLSPQEFFGFGVSGESQAEPAMGGGFSMEVWREMTNYGGSSKKSSKQDMGMGMDFSNFDLAKYNQIFNNGMTSGAKKSIADYNILNFGSSGKKAKAPSMDDIKRFYGM